MTPLRSFFAALVPVVSAGVLFAACADSETIDGSTGSTESTGTTNPSGACILHNCNTNEECGGCSEGRNTCLTAEHRCVACDAGTDSGCPEGEVCSSFGNCVPEGLECPTDAQGTPTNPCATSADCAACAPDHRVCNMGQCKACTDNDTTECQSTDKCEDGNCVPKCSDSCDDNNDCIDCMGAPACNAHRCSECGPTWACPSGESCTPQGVCQKVCGIQGEPGVCNVSSDCAGCGMGYTCKTPINGGKGVCIPPAAGCSDLGQGALSLPAPFDQVTQTCSNDPDCDNVSVDYNIGKALRDLTGFGPNIIDDANISYGMNVCASIEIANNSCGLCVPCRVDSDCADVDVDAFASDLFPGVIGVALAVLLDSIFGDNEHTVFMYCETVAAGYGVCAPCPGLVNDCAVQDPGDPMNCPGTVSATCCADVCAVDPYCCETEWDSYCDTESTDICASAACHDVCEVGAALDDSCGACAQETCAADPYCCSTSWDQTCVDEAAASCATCVN